MSVAVIQARMGSTRLPGKVMFPLGDRHVLHHVVNRVAQAAEIGSVVVATSAERKDDVIAHVVPEFGAHVYRGSETDVLGRMFEAARGHNATRIVRITADCPLIDPDVIDLVLKELERRRADYASNIQTRTFPRGLDVEAFTFESFERIHSEATESHHREHVTPYYRETDSQFDTVTVTSEMAYDETHLLNRDDVRLTLDEAADYELLRRVYNGVDYDNLLPIEDAISYIDEHGLGTINDDIEQIGVSDASDNSS